MVFLDKKNCQNLVCTKSLEISVNSEVLVLTANHQIEYKDNVYSPEETSRFLDLNLFTVNSVGNSLFVKLRQGRVEIEWFSSGSFTIMVSNIMTLKSVLFFKHIWQKLR